MTSDPETISECAAEFVPSARADVEAIVAAAGAGDADALWRVSHRLKGSAALFGAQALKQACGDLETAAGVSDWQAVGRIVPKLGALLADVEQALTAFIHRLRAA